MRPDSKTVRCAIYTRKSTEAGLEQEFNTLDAQREAAEAYVRSQRSEGWRIVKTHYDDGGFSGGNAERPALKRLLDDIRANKVDAVLVYKVDRLTRSLADFAKLIELFDANGVSFVSVTQQFNTSSSMGRLTLNVLLSFAQFEREITGERLRDKILASRKKGIFMGGTPPMGYDVKDRKLVVIEEEAALVRQIFHRYLELKSVGRLADALAADGVLTRKRVSRSGNSYGGCKLSTGHLSRILTNRTYIGEAPHKDASYPGEHVAIVPKELFDAVAAQLEENRQKRTTIFRQRKHAILRGLLFDQAGETMTPTHTNKGARRYHYYVTHSALRSGVKPDDKIYRIAAADIESIVERALVTLILARSQAPSTGAVDLSLEQLKPLISRIDVRADRIDIVHQLITGDIARAILRGQIPAPSQDCADETTCAPFAMRTKDGRPKMISPDASEPLTRQRRNSLLKAVVRGYAWRKELEAGKALSIGDIARSANLSDRYVSRMIKFGYLAPDIIEAIVNDENSGEAALLEFSGSIPLDWREQRKMFASVLGR